MNNQDNQTFNWVVKQGSILMYADKDRIHFEINTENNSCCLLTEDDAEDITGILTELSGNIWDNPEYIQEPYTGRKYELAEDGKVYWTINEAKLSIGLNEGEDALEMNLEGSSAVELSVNQAVEVLQIMTHFAGKL